MRNARPAREREVSSRLTIDKPRRIPLLSSIDDFSLSVLESVVVVPVSVVGENSIVVG